MEGVERMTNIADPLLLPGSGLFYMRSLGYVKRTLYNYDPDLTRVLATHECDGWEESRAILVARPAIQRIATQHDVDDVLTEWGWQMDLDEFSVPITVCPFCGEKLPE